jgi:hypothetical protein
VAVQRVNKDAARRQVAAALTHARSAHTSLRTTPMATPGVSPTKRGERPSLPPVPGGAAAGAGRLGGGLPPLVPLGAKAAAGMPPVNQIVMAPAVSAGDGAGADDDIMRPI